MELQNLGLRIDDGEHCIFLPGQSAIFLHGSPEAMIRFAEEIIKEAEAKLPKVE